MKEVCGLGINAGSLGPAKKMLWCETKFGICKNFIQKKFGICKWGTDVDDWIQISTSQDFQMRGTDVDDWISISFMAPTHHNVDLDEYVDREIKSFFPRNFWFLPNFMAADFTILFYFLLLLMSLPYKFVGE